jgi:hypothetical protein
MSKVKEEMVQIYFSTMIRHVFSPDTIRK